MSEFTVQSQITPRYLRNKTKDEIIDLFMLSLKENDQLREALAELVDNQNGRPLPSYTTWDDAMNEANRLLGCTSHKIVNGEWVEISVRGQ